MKITIYGIPSCGTVKKARAWLDAQGLAHDWVDFRTTAPEPARVARWVAAFGSGPMRNTSGGAYRELPAEKADWDEAEWTRRFQGDAMLIRRPVLEIDGQPALVGFKEEAWRGRLG